MQPPKIINQKEIQQKLSNPKDWQIKGDKLVADFIFNDFTQAFEFMTTLAPEFEKSNHHPEWTNSYKKVSISFTTHEVGDKITDRDVRMANVISDIFKNFI